MLGKNNYIIPLLGGLLFLSVVFAFTPILRSGMLLLLTELGLMTVVLSHSMSKNYRCNGSLVLAVYLYLLMCIVYRLLGISSIAPGALAIHLFFFISILIMLQLPNLTTERQNNRMAIIMIIVILFNVLDNIRLCLTYPELYVLVNRDMESVGENLNIGGSKFYNALFFFFTICFFFFMNSRNKRNRIIMLVGVLLTAAFILAFCLKASVIVFTFLSAFLLFFAKKAKNTKSFILRIFIPAMIAYGLVSIFSDLIIELITNTFSSDRLAQRLILLIDSDSPDATRGAATVEARENLWLMSINTWTDNIVNFIFGIGDHRADWAAGQTAAETGIGQHSDFLDSLARYGLLGSLIILQILILSFKYLLSYFEEKYRLQVLVIIILFVLFGFTKAVFQVDIGILLFVFLPLMCRKELMMKNN